MWQTYIIKCTNWTESEWLIVVRGVPQGTVIGPLLFNPCVNDTYKTVNCDFIQKADDTLLLSNGLKISHCKKKKINQDKVELIVFGNK